MTDEQIDAEIDRQWGSVADYGQFRSFVSPLLAGKILA